MPTNTTPKSAWETPIISNLSISSTSETCTKAIAVADGAIANCGS